MSKKIKLSIIFFTVISVAMQNYNCIATEITPITEVETVEIQEEIPEITPAVTIEPSVEPTPIVTDNPEEIKRRDEELEKSLPQFSTISIKLNNQSDYSEDVEIKLTNKKTKELQKFKLKYSEYSKEFPISATLEQGEYTVQLNYKKNNDYSIVDGANKIIDKLVVGKTDKTFELFLVNKGALVYDDSLNDATSTFTYADANATSNINIIQTSNINQDSNTGKEIKLEDGILLWNTIVEQLDDLEVNDKDAFANLVNEYEKLKNTKVKRFIRAKGGTEKDYFDLTPKERFLLNLGYIDTAAKILTEDSNEYTGSLENWLNNTCDFNIQMLERYAPDIAINFKKLMEWDYYYYLSTGNAYDFIDGNLTQDQLQNLQEQQKNLEEQDMQQGQTEPTAVVSDDEENNTSIWGSFQNSVKSHIFSILLLVVLLGMLFGFIYYRKKKTIDDSEE